MLGNPVLQPPHVLPLSLSFVRRLASLARHSHTLSHIGRSSVRFFTYVSWFSKAIENRNETKNWLETKKSKIFVLNRWPENYPSRIWFWDSNSRLSEHESSPITTRPYHFPQEKSLQISSVMLSTLFGPSLNLHCRYLYCPVFTYLVPAGAHVIDKF